jgi:hypothetical protein|tara:strand:- start:381 stop:536 length:156 start_codon:yes stop_codon:yes gene_type:complete
MKKKSELEEKKEAEIQRGLNLVRVLHDREPTEDDRVKIAAEVEKLAREAGH